MSEITPERRAAIESGLQHVSLARTLGLKLTHLAPGEAHLSMDDRRDLDGIFHSLHGGILATLADSAIAFAGLTLIDPSEQITTIEFNIRFLAPCREGVVAKARVIKAGRTLITGEVELVGQSSGTLFAISGITYMRLQGKS